MKRLKYGIELSECPFCGGVHCIEKVETADDYVYKCDTCNKEFTFDEVAA